MFLLIFTSLGLCILVHTSNPWLITLRDTVFFYAGLSFSILCLLIVVFKKNPPRLSFDVFATGSLLAWFSHWQSLFNNDSPMFFFFPLYFVFAAAFIELALLSQQSRMDETTLRAMQAFARDSRIQPWLVMTVVLGSLWLVEHYLLYPVAMTVLLIRIAMQRYLEETQQRLRSGSR